jgi:hypothetical protein
MADHDQFFKVLLREFIGEFFELFFPDWAKRFDFASVEWLDKELFLDPPKGEKRSIDLLARLPTLQPATPDDTTWLALVHVEVESDDKVAPLRRRMFEYYEYLRRLYNLPVLPIGLYLRVGLDGVGWDTYEETFWEHVLVRFQYAYVGLAALNAEEYVGRDNWLGVALTALMRVPAQRRVELARQAWRRLVQCPLNEYRRYLLCECVDTYTPLAVAERQALEAEVVGESDAGVRAMSMGLLEKWRQKGRQEVLVKQLDARFGPLSCSVRERVAALSGEAIDALAVALLTAKTLAELRLEELTVDAGQNHG